MTTGVLLRRRRLSEPLYQAFVVLGVAVLFAVLVAVRGIAPAGAVTQNYGTIPVGASFTATGLCGYSPGSSTTVTAGGLSYTRTADAAGCVNVLVRVASQSQVAYDEAIFPTANCTQNTFVVDGNAPGAAASGGGGAATGGGGGPVQNVGTFAISCPTPVVNNPPPSQFCPFFGGFDPFGNACGTPLGTPVAFPYGGASQPGYFAPSVGNQQQQQQQSVTVAPTATTVPAAPAPQPAPARVAFTGSPYTKTLTGIAILMLMAGLVLVTPTAKFRRWLGFASRG
jgi:hypothetical protein